MSGLTIGNTYQVSFWQASNEEHGNNKPYDDNWLAYIKPSATEGAYIRPDCTPVVSAPGGWRLAYASTVMANAGATSTPRESESFTFVASQTSEVLEFVAQAVAVTSGAFQPPFLDLAAVTTQQVTPEPGTWTWPYAAWVDLPSDDANSVKNRATGNRADPPIQGYGRSDLGVLQLLMVLPLTILSAAIHHLIPSAYYARIADLPWTWRIAAGLMLNEAGGPAFRDALPA
jgi:hypothetical protein